MVMSQSSPSKAPPQIHLKPPDVSLHVPPLWQGLAEHASTGGDVVVVVVADVVVDVVGRCVVVVIVVDVVAGVVTFVKQSPSEWKPGGH